MNYFKKSSLKAQFIAGFVLLFCLIFVPSLPSFATQNFATQNATAQIGQILQEFGKTQNQANAQTAPIAPLPQPVAPAPKADELQLTAPVMDYAGVLNDSEERQLNEQLYKIYQDKLAQIAVVIVPTTDGVPIFDYTMAVAKRFGLGRRETDDGVLILVAINDKDLFIATGYGVEGVLPDATLKRIIREDITPSFKNGAYAQGLSAGIARIDERLRADPSTLAKADNATKQNRSVNLVEFFIPAIVVGLFLGNVLGRFLGASVAAGGFVFFTLMLGASVGSVLLAAVILWLFLLFFSVGGIALPSDSYRTGGRNGGHGNFGGFGGGSGGSYRGGGGSFGGGGAGGSW